jgi:hypothetical protein
MILTAAILSAMIVLLQTATTLTSVTAMQQANSDMVDYYRQFNHLDNTVVTSNDLLGYLTRYKNDLSAYIIAPSGHRITLENDVLTFLRYNSSTGNYTPETNHNLEWFANYSLTPGKTFKVILLEDGESISDISNINDEYYDGGVITGIYAIVQ